MTNQTELNLTPDQPSEITTETSAEFFAVCNRAHAGEFVIEYLETLRSKNGANNGGWMFKVRWKK